MKYVLLFLLTFSSVAFAKMTPQEIEKKCRNLSFEKQKRIKACIPYTAVFTSEADPLLGKYKNQSGVTLKAQGLMGSVSGFEGMMGYNYSQVELGLFGGSLESKENSEVGQFKGSFYGGYIQYNFMPLALHRKGRVNPFMGAKLGSTNLLVIPTGDRSSFPYVGLNAGLSYPVMTNMGLTMGLDLHQIIHPEKNLFHLGSSLNLGLMFNF